MRVAIVHDWLYVVGGAERVLREMLACYPQADVFALFDALSPEDRARIGLGRTRTSFLQRMPFIAKRHRFYLPLMPIAIEQLDLSEYDLVISSSYAVAKGVITGPDQVHVAYVHSPMRYAWDLQHAYLRESGYGRGLLGPFVRLMLHGLRIWDARTANGPDAMIANSAFVARRIRKVYGRDARVIHPPVTLARRDDDLPRDDHFLVASRLVAYKNIDAVVEAFRALPHLKLVVAGDGPEAGRLRALGVPNVSFAGYVSDEALRHLMTTARAFVFAAEEDFGIIPLEAQAEGTPVLALGRGGARETVVTSGPGRTGLFFANPKPDEIAACIRSFIAQEGTFSREACRRQAERFSAERFRREFTTFVEGRVAAHGQPAPDNEPYIYPVQKRA
ncbi:glycosyltransferase [Methylobacterium trifolii]|uniref:D-inositol-3-phosphate glycosyltransferase n=1 Tax=Methylobacterium trifolii TaxID=1003092 RepID=A0ABQ4U026_9HYPH|nr:glycosyltransferase [Methylobacterium trifolii]GJE60641.1 D-inositol-3-phosphate glycosyltransferase [Methylobacterium trifolii]